MLTRGQDDFKTVVMALEVGSVIHTAAKGTGIREHVLNRLGLHHIWFSERFWKVCDKGLGARLEGRKVLGFQ